MFEAKRLCKVVVHSCCLVLIRLNLSFSKLVKGVLEAVCSVVVIQVWVNYIRIFIVYLCIVQRSALMLVGSVSTLIQI